VRGIAIVTCAVAAATLSSVGSVTEGSRESTSSARSQIASHEGSMAPDSLLTVQLPELGLQVVFPRGVSAWHPQDRVRREPHYLVGVRMGTKYMGLILESVTFEGRGSVQEFAKSYHPEPGGDGPDHDEYQEWADSFDQQERALASGTAPQGYALSWLGQKVCLRQCEYDSPSACFGTRAIVFFDSVRVIVKLCDDAWSLPDSLRNSSVSVCEVRAAIVDSVLRQIDVRRIGLADRN
jgi:hypothetical protein